MPSLLLVIFILQLLIHIVNSIGKSTINEVLWILYSKLPTPIALSVQHANRQRAEVLRLKKEMNAVSAQDDFARWAKLRRQHDKASAEYDKIAASIKTHKSTFDTIASTLRWLGLNGLRFVMQFWFSKIPIYWLPAGWLPWYAEWILSFPSAPIGSISVQTWWIACVSAIMLAGEAGTAVLGLVYGQGEGLGEKQKGEPMAFAADPMTEGEQQVEEKKEL